MKFKSKLNYQTLNWAFQLPIIRSLSMVDLRKQYKYYYRKVPLNCDREFLIRKISYRFMWLSMLHNNITMSDKLRNKALIVFNEQPQQRGGVEMDKAKAKKPKVTIASIVYEMIKAGKSDEKIIEAIKKKFPESKISESHMSWYRAQEQAGGKKKVKSDKPDAKAKKAKKLEVEEEEDEVENEDEVDETEDETEDENEEEDK